MRTGKGMTFDPTREECYRAPGMASHHLSWPPWKYRTEYIHRSQRPPRRGAQEEQRCPRFLRAEGPKRVSRHSFPDGGGGGVRVGSRATGSHEPGSPAPASLSYCVVVYLG